jgi:hypothetical protein
MSRQNEEISECNFFRDTSTTILSAIISNCKSGGLQLITWIYIFVCSTNHLILRNKSQFIYMLRLAVFVNSEKD